MEAASVSLLDLAQGKALLRPSDAVARGHSRLYLAQLAQRGLVHKVSRGLYALPQRKASEFASFAEVASKHPQALVCLLSALAFHGLTTQAPFEVWIAVDNKARAPQMPYPPLRIARFSGSALTEGVELHNIEGVPVKITSVPKRMSFGITGRFAGCKTSCVHTWKD